MGATSAEKKTQYSAPGPISAPAGTSFIFVNITLTNGGSIDITTSAKDFTIISQSGFSFPPKQLSMLSYNPYPYDPFVVGAGKTVGGRILFVVPDVVSQLRFQTSTSSGIAQWILPW